MSILCKIGAHTWSVWGDVFTSNGQLFQQRYCWKCRKADLRQVNMPESEQQRQARIRNSRQPQRGDPDFIPSIDG